MLLIDEAPCILLLLNSYHYTPFFHVRNASGEKIQRSHLLEQFGQEFPTFLKIVCFAI